MTANARPASQASQARRAARRSAARLIPDLRVGEEVVLIRRPHPMALLLMLRWPLLVFALWLLSSLVVVWPYIGSLERDYPYAGEAVWLPSALWLGWLSLVAAPVLWASYLVLDWTGDWVALTTRRFIIMDKTPLLRESRREAPLDRIENVVTQYTSGAGVAFDYGALKVDTAGIGVLVFENLPHPKAVRAAIFTQQEKLGARPPSPEDLRKASVRAFVLGSAPKSRGGAQGSDNSTKLNAQYSKLNVLFPFSAHRHGGGVTWHKHWFFLLLGVATPIVLWVLSVFAWIASISLSEQGQFSSAATILGWLAVGLFPLCLAWVLWSWEDWRNDRYRLDGVRVCEIKSLPFGLREQSKETMIGHISDATYLVPGLVAQLLDYGDVVLKTPGEGTEFAFKGVPHPRAVQQEIMDRLEEYRLGESTETDREIEAWLKAYHGVMRET